MGYMDLKKHAKGLGLKQKVLAAEMGVSEATMSKWINRGLVVPTPYLRQLADRLQVPVEELLPTQAVGE